MAAASLVLELLRQQWQVTVAILLLPLASFLLTRRRSSNLNGCDESGGLRLPPCPWRLPMVGNLHQIGSLPHRDLARLARRHGPVMMVRLGMVPAVVLSTAAAAEEAFKTNDKDCSSRPLTVGPGKLTYGYKDVVFAPWSDYVREMRKLFIIEMLSARRVKAAYFARETQIERMVAKLEAVGPNPIRIDEHIFTTVDAIVSLFVFGELNAGEQFKGELVDLLNETTDLLTSFTAEDYFPNAAGRLIDRITGMHGRRETLFRKLDSMMEYLLAMYEDPGHKRKADADGSDLVQEVVDLMKRPPAKGMITFTRDHAKSILFDTFMAATDTSSISSYWVMTELIRHPRVLHKAQAEVRAAAGGAPQVRISDMPKLKYLRMVLSETFRMHPPATMLVPRETMRPIRLGGYDIPANTMLMVNAWAIGRDPASWKDPEVFYPERFEELDVDFNGGHYELLPFGAGRRICPGLAMGVANTEFILANLLYCFNWALPQGMRSEDVGVEEFGGLTFRKKKPLVLVPTRYYPDKEEK